MGIKIALAGNPNSGKTTLFNAWTGSRQYVGNWPGVTVEKKEGKLKDHDDVTIQDLPGIYSLSPYTLEEVVSRTYLVNEKPDAIMNIVDGTNIERNLYLTTQLMELGIPVVMGVNMMDLVRKNGDSIDVKKLSKELGIPVMEISALKGENIDRAAQMAIDAAESGKAAPAPAILEGEAKEAVDHICADLKGKVDDRLLLWFGIKIFERDSKILEHGAGAFTKNDLADMEKYIEAAEKSYDDDSESIITNERYEYIGGIVAKAVKKHGEKHAMTLSDRVDRIVTNRFLGLPIFIAVMALIYAVSMGGANGSFGAKIGIGTIGTNWVNDVLFGELVPGWVDKLLLGVLHISEGGIVYGMIQDGIVAGVGAVLGFVPQIVVMFFCLAILEDIGYMSRVAFVMDRLFRQFGLSGKSFIPVLVGVGCGVPGVMATRTIENNRDRRLTVMVTTFIPCGAKMPIIGLIAGAVFGGNSLIAVSAYVIGLASIILSGIILKKFKAFAGEPAPFVMELPAYHVPSTGNVLRATWERGSSFVKRAGSVIVISTILIWFLSSFGFLNGSFGFLNNKWDDTVKSNPEVVTELADKMNVEENEVSSMDASLLASVSQKISFLFAPQGFNKWRPTVATVTGLVAKENVVGTFGVLYNYQGDEDLAENGDQIWANVKRDYTPMSAFAFMCFNLLCAPCFAAMGAIKREMNNAKWTWAAIGWMCGWAYMISTIAYRLGGLLVGEVPFGIGTVLALVFLGLILYGLFRKGYKPEGEIKNLTSVEAMAAAE
ncbi:MAG: ferrous iron transport protein B [Eubacteriales bacterium]|nr:ferrous iron transport protein B [Eubacteriales bacterium]